MKSNYVTLVFKCSESLFPVVDHFIVILSSYFTNKNQSKALSFLFNFAFEYDRVIFLFFTKTHKTCKFFMPK